MCAAPSADPDVSEVRNEEDPKAYSSDPGTQDDAASAEAAAKAAAHASGADEPFENTSIREVPASRRLPHNPAAAAAVAAYWASIELLSAPDFAPDEYTFRWSAEKPSAAEAVARDAWTKAMLEESDLVLDLSVPPEQLKHVLPVFRVMVGVIPKRAYYRHLMRTLRVPGTEAGDLQEGGLENVRGDIFLASFELNPWGRLVPESFGATGAVGVLDHLRLLRRYAETTREKIDVDAFTPADAEVRIAKIAEKFHLAASTALNWSAPLRTEDAVLQRKPADMHADSGSDSDERHAVGNGSAVPKLMRFSNAAGGTPVTAEWIDLFAQRLADRIGWNGPVSVAVRIEYESPYRNPEPRRDLLDSFYLADLTAIGRKLTEPSDYGALVPNPAYPGCPDQASHPERPEDEDSAALKQAAPPSGVGVPLCRLFDGMSDPAGTKAGRIDVLAEPNALANLLAPAKLPAARWPIAKDLHLYVAQQGAVSLAASLAGGDETVEADETEQTMRSVDDFPDAQRLLAVNGPPGTGKSFLLRDLIAEVVVERAKRLAALDDPEKLLAEGPLVRFVLPKDDVCEFRTPQRVVTGDGVVVVASNNNAAIRNITDDLPRAFGLEVRKPFAYWAEPAGAFLWAVGPGRSQGSGSPTRTDGAMRGRRRAFEREVWGLASATLGRASNCSAFVRTVLTKSRRRTVQGDPNEEFQTQTAVDLLEAMTDEAEHAAARDRWADARHAFLKALRRVEADRTAIAQRAGRMTPSVFMTPLKKNPEQHKTSVWVDSAFEAHRSELFLAALTLHRATIEADAAHWIDTLAGAGKWLRNPRVSLLSGRASYVLEALAMLVPVISTTLASSSRLLSGIASGEIGWVFIDEASQATPASAAGLLDRARRAVVIGDTRQLPPIVTLPERLCEHLRRRMKGVGTVWSPARSSLQSIADFVMPWGTTIRDAVTGEDVWTGFPLRTHLRCGSPMFDIANAVSYDGQMVQMTPRRDAANPERSCWIDVEETGASPQADIGSAIRRGKVNPTEMAVLEGVLRGLLQDRMLEGSGIFVISPFRSVADAAQRLIEAHRWEDRLRADTVHAFQGQEADVVVLVLGSTPGKPGRLQRRWAARPANLINVAVTRAKSDLIIIGNMRDWCAEPLFAIAAGFMRRGMLAPGEVFTSVEDAQAEARRHAGVLEERPAAAQTEDEAGVRSGESSEKAERPQVRKAPVRIPAPTPQRVVRALEAMRTEAPHQEPSGADSESLEKPERTSSAKTDDPLAALAKPIDDLPWTW